MKPISNKELLAAGLVILNLLVLTPVAWVAGYIWDETQQWRRDTEQQIQQLGTEINNFRTEMALNFVTRAEFQEHSNRVNDRLINQSK